MCKISKGLAKKLPEMVLKGTIVTTRLGETVFTYSHSFRSLEVQHKKLIKSCNFSKGFNVKMLIRKLLKDVTLLIKSPNSVLSP